MKRQLESTLIALEFESIAPRVQHALQQTYCLSASATCIQCCVPPLGSTCANSFVKSGGLVLSVSAGFNSKEDPCVLTAAKTPILHWVVLSCVLMSIGGYYRHTKNFEV